jgi:hypothetical protein
MNFKIKTIENDQTAEVLHDVLYGIGREIHATINNLLAAAVEENPGLDYKVFEMLLWSYLVHVTLKQCPGLVADPAVLIAVSTARKKLERFAKKSPELQEILDSTSSIKDPRVILYYPGGPE